MIASRRVFQHFPALKQNIKVKLILNQGIRERLASEYIHGSGIEIGALQAAFGTSGGTRVQYVDKHPTDFLRGQYPELSHCKLVEVDIVDDGEFLREISDESQDFVIANHFVEHCQDPINAIGNMALHA